MRLATMPEARAPRYEIETLLGSGPTGTTYLARAIDDGTLLAVKAIAPAETSRDTFFDLGELRLSLLDFRDENVARMCALDAADDDGVHLVREYVRGRPFDEWIAKAEASAGHEVLDRLVEAVGRIHAQGLAHGHLTRANIVIAADDRPIIVDLGAQPAFEVLRGRRLDLDAMRADDRARLEDLRRWLMGRL